MAGNISSKPTVLSQRELRRTVWADFEGLIELPYWFHGRNGWPDRRQGNRQKPPGPGTHRLKFYRFRKALAPVMQGGYRNPFLRTVIPGRKAARLKAFYLVPPISGFLVLRHPHPSSLNADQDRPGQKIWEGGLLRRLQYIEVFYNRSRRHSLSGFVSPEQFLRDWIKARQTRGWLHNSGPSEGEKPRKAHNPLDYAKNRMKLGAQVNGDEVFSLGSACPALYISMEIHYQICQIFHL